MVWAFLFIVFKDLIMDPADRPLSPHLQIYKPQLTSVLAIMHRISGVGLGLGTLLLAYWLIAVASGPAQFEAAQGLIGSWVGMVLLVAWTFGLFYHLCNGVRHLFWDSGLGYELATVYRSGWLIVAASVVGTVAVWGSVLIGRGV